MSGKAVSTTATSARKFRILALPLARLPKKAGGPSPASTSTSEPSSTSKTAPTPLMLYHVIQPETTPDQGPPSLTKRALDKASDTWLKLGEKPKDSVLYWFYNKGERLMDRIEYEEWALKSIHEGQGVKIVDEKDTGKVQERIEIPLLKPTLEPELPTLLPKLHRLLIHRIPFHKKMMWRSIIASPLTWPFAIIPIIPNFPLFYVLWRAWSHYKAWRGAVYLEQLLQRGMIVEETSKALDEVYAAKGVVFPAEGQENLAPDTTNTDKVKAPKISAADGTMSQEAVQAGESIPAQAKGQEGAPDGTATPDAMVFDGKSTPAEVDIEAGAPRVPRHPDLLLGPNQVPFLAREFNFRPLEVIDVNRAVEQAETRLRQAEKEKENAGASASSSSA